MPVRNGILAALSLPDFDYLRAFIQPVSLEKGAVLNEANKEIEYVNFVETGIVSLMTLASGSMLETAMVGRNGAVEAPLALGAATSIHKSIVLVPGKALRVRAEHLHRSMEERPKIRDHLLSYVKTLIIHSSQMGLCGVRHQLEQRLACWLCLACDAMEGEMMAITHDHLSLILGLRRTGVTESLMRFEELGLVRRGRGVLQVTDRRSLGQKACGCYRMIVAASGRMTPVIGPALTDLQNNDRKSADNVVIG